MSRKPSVETQLKITLRDLKEMRKQFHDEWTRANTFKAIADSSKREAEEWKSRFDLLLSKCVEVKKP